MAPPPPPEAVSATTTTTTATTTTTTTPPENPVLPTPTPTKKTIQGNAKPLPLGAISPPKFKNPYAERHYLKHRLACAFRIFARYGFDEGVAGHITVRDPVDPTCFWVNPFGLHFSLIKASDLILVDHSGKVVDGGANRLLNTAAFMIHSAIHESRPDVICAAHSHSIYGRSFCSLGKKLDMITQDSCAFYNDHVLFDQFNGVVLAAEEGKAIARALGNQKAALLQNHGLLTTGNSIEEAIFWFISLDKCCHAQLLADAAGKTIKIGEEEAAFTHQTIGSRMAGWFSGKPLFDKVTKDEGVEFMDEEEPADE